MSAPQSIEAVLASEGKFVTTTSGGSMWPLFADRRDTVVIVPKNGRLKKYDVPLYRRGEEYVLHRIVKVLPDGYLTCGDNCEVCETVAEDEVIGIMSAFYRKERYIEAENRLYRAYSCLWVAIFRVRVFVKRALRKLKKLLRGNR